MENVLNSEESIKTAHSSVENGPTWSYQPFHATVPLKGCLISEMAGRAWAGSSPARGGTIPTLYSVHFSPSSSLASSPLPSLSPSPTGSAIPHITSLKEQSNIFPRANVHKSPTVL